MITSLHIKNIAVIKEADIDFMQGFSVLSGETGAGKSVIIDSIGILLGSRSAKGKIRSGEDEAFISACFEKLSSDAAEELKSMGFDADEGIMLQRRISSDGKNTIKLNGQTISAGVCKEIGKLLLTIHGQNDTQRLMQKTAHLEILDSYGDLRNERDNYLEVYEKYKNVSAKLNKVKSESQEKIRLLDIYKYQVKEIEDVNPKIGEEERLLAEEKRLSNAEKIEKHSFFTYRLLKGSEKSVIAAIDRAYSSISQISDSVEEAEALLERLEQAKYEIEDIAYTVNGFADGIEGSSEEKLDKIENRLDAIQRLKRKYGNTVEEILEFRKKTGYVIDEMENSDEIIEKLEKELERLSVLLSERANELTEKRKFYAKKLQEEIRYELEFLEMPKVRFVIDIAHKAEAGESGFDDVEFLVSANAGQEPMPMIKIASGGELSRIMLAVKSVLLDKDGASTVIFDEIDTGISGKTSRKVGIKLKQISKIIQVICVTHSAQIASLADNNHLISKSEVGGATQTKVSLLDDEGRIREVARILGGLNITQSQLDAAREMVEEGKLL